VVCRLHAVLCELLPGGVSKQIIAGQAAAILGSSAITLVKSVMARSLSPIFA